MSWYRRLLSNFMGFVALFLVGCTLQTQTIESKNEENIITEDSQNANAKEMSSYVEQGNIEVVDSIFLRKERNGLIEIEIHYPQVQDVTVTNGEAGDNINKIIYDYIMDVAYAQWYDCQYNISIDYQITFFDEHFLSIIFEGSYNEFMCPACPGALVFDLDSGKQLSLIEYIDYEEFLKLLVSNDSIIQECENIDLIGGREQVKQYFFDKTDVSDHLYDWAIIDNGIKIIQKWEQNNNRYHEYEIIDILFE